MSGARPGIGARLRALSPRARASIAVGAWLVATALLALALRAVGWRQVTQAIAHAHGGWLAVAVLANLSIVALWAWQTQVLLPRGTHVGYWRLFEVQALTTTATNTVPAFLGQATGVALLAERGGVGSAASLAVFAQHNVVEGLAKLAVLLLAAQVAPLPGWMHGALLGLATAVGALVVTLGAFAFLAARRPAAPAPATAPTGRLARARAFVERTAAGLAIFHMPRRFALALLTALLMKAAEATGWLAVERAFGVATPPGSPLLALAAVNLASALAASPGNLGVYEAAAFFVYGYLGVPRQQALAVAVLGHVCYLLPLAGTGYALLSLQGLKRLRRRRPA